MLSSDGGKSWNESLPRVFARLSQPYIPRHLWRVGLRQGGGSGRGAAFSGDGGLTWSQPDEGLDRHYGWPSPPIRQPLRSGTCRLRRVPSRHTEKGTHQAYIFRNDGQRWQRLAGDCHSLSTICLFAHYGTQGTRLHLRRLEQWRHLVQAATRGDHWQQLPVKLEKHSARFLCCYLETVNVHPKHWRQLILRCYWDERKRPRPGTLGDFFCNGWCVRASGR